MENTKTETIPEPQENVSENQTTTETSLATESTPQEINPSSELPSKKEKKNKKHRHVDPQDPSEPNSTETADTGAVVKKKKKKKKKEYDENGNRIKRHSSRRKKAASEGEVPEDDVEKKKKKTKKIVYDENGNPIKRKKKKRVDEEPKIEEKQEEKKEGKKEEKEEEVKPEVKTEEKVKKEVRIENTAVKPSKSEGAVLTPVTEPKSKTEYKVVKSWRSFFGRTGKEKQLKMQNAPIAADKERIEALVQQKLTEITFQKYASSKNLTEMLSAKSPIDPGIKSENKKAVFGQPIKGKIPDVILKCFEILQEKAIYAEGIFRVPGSHAKIQEIKRLVDKGKKVSLESENVHTVGGVLKQWLREIPHPIVLGNKYKNMILKSAELLHSADLFIPYLHGLMTKLPPNSYEILNLLISLLNKISRHSEATKMTENTLAIVFSGYVVASGDMSRSTASHAVVAEIIKEYEKIFLKEENMFFYVGKAMFAHTGRFDNELSFDEGDEVLIFKKVDSNYYYGYHLRSDRFGDVISKYIKVDELGEIYDEDVQYNENEHYVSETANEEYQEEQTWTQENEEGKATEDNNNVEEATQEPDLATVNEEQNNAQNEVKEKTAVDEENVEENNTVVEDK